MKDNFKWWLSREVEADEVVESICRLTLITPLKLHKDRLKKQESGTEELANSIKGPTKTELDIQAYIPG